MIKPIKNLIKLAGFRLWGKVRSTTDAKLMIIKYLVKLLCITGVHT
jgi:hypothetical protein